MSQDKSRRVSVVVPVLGSAELLEPCLASIRRSTDWDDCEVIVVDDGSPAALGIGAVCQRHGARLIRFPENLGPSAARNAGARAASGDIVVFLDADVTAYPDTLKRIADAFEQGSKETPPLDALMGSYDSKPGASGWVSAFRNLLHTHVHHRSDRTARTFWTGCGAVRRDRFLDLGGFDETRRAIEDVEFGLRLHSAGGRIDLDPTIQVTHRKHFTVWSMLATDTFSRAMPWAELVQEHGLPRDLNFRWRDRLAGAAAVLLPALGYLAIRFGRGWWLLAAAALLSMAVLELPLFRFLARVRGWGFALASLPLYLFHLLAAAGGFAMGLMAGLFRRERGLLLATGFLTVLVAAVQIGSGAYQAEFDSHPDEPAHFMTGLMIRDYLAQMPTGSPLEWAKQYYMHYPKVTFGHWPPLFHVIEAGWWLFTPPSRTSGMILIGLFGILAAVGMYRLARSVTNLPIALLVASALVATSLFQEALSQQMAEMLILLFGTYFLAAVARFLRDGAPRALAMAGLWCTLSLLVKGTGVALLLALFLVMIFAGRRRIPSVRWLLAPVLLLVAGIGWYLLQDESLAVTASWAGLSWHGPRMWWPVPGLVGWGLCALAAMGLLSLTIKREPVAGAAGAMLLSILASSLFLGAMAEARHWILALPGLLLLAMTAVHRLSAIASPRVGMTAAVILSLGALVLFPWSRYVQQAAGYRILAEGIPQPGRMMVGATQSGLEGSWIVLASLREPRPSSLIARASKVLARSGWSGHNPRVLVATPAEVLAILDRYGIETVVLDERRPEERPAGYKLLKKAVSESGAWRLCSQTEGLRAYARIEPVRNWEPLTINIGWRSMGQISEQ